MPMVTGVSQGLEGWARAMKCFYPEETHVSTHISLAKTRYMVIPNSGKKSTALLCALKVRKTSYQ